MKATTHCACCGYLTIDEEYDICPVCDWEADPVQERDPTRAGGANGISLIEARANFQAMGAKGLDHLKHVRPPQPHEVADSD
jgi:hypothetical protein